MLNNTDIETIASLLEKLKPGYLPRPIFEQFARLTALPVIELVPVRKRADGTVEVLLIERPKDDIIWPGELHVPGTVIRASDETDSFKAAFDRLLDDELAGTATGEPRFVANILNRSKRGAESSQIYFIEITGEPKVGTFYPADSLPSATVASQLAFVERAVNVFKSSFLS